MPDGFGLNKLARLLSKRAEKEGSQIQVGLNPPFPYDIVPFESALFGVENYSDAEPDNLTERAP